MPAIHNTTYKRPTGFLSGHWETIYPAFFRKVKDLETPKRQRIDTPDGDFLDLDWWSNGNSRIIILQHGLEGSSDRPYMLGMARQFIRNGYDVLAWNFRGCSGTMNRKKRFYHSGATDDLETVINHVPPDYEDLTLLGFSLGGNLTLKFLGEKVRDIRIRRGIAISAPLDLDTGADNLKKRQNHLYELRFLNNLKKKVVEKSRIIPEQISTDYLPKIKSIRDFDEYYTAPLHGFTSARDYYRRCSSKYFLEGIQIPTLILNALNDPLLSKESLDKNLTKNLQNVFMETTSHGGHVGFIQRNKEGVYWSEERALAFCQEHE